MGRERVFFRSLPILYLGANKWQLKSVQRGLIRL
jgi:hypothetical protein